MSEITNAHMKTPRERTIADRHRREHQARFANSASAGPTLHSSRTLSTFERKGVISLKYVDTYTRIDTQYQNPNTIQSAILSYNQYVEALNSLRHNCNFVLLGSKFSKKIPHYLYKI